MATVTAYIDGFNLYHGLRARYQHRYLWLDLPALVRRLRPRDTITAVRYFTAMVRDDPPAEARQRAYLAALAAHNGPELQIIHGRYQAKTTSAAPAAPPGPATRRKRPTSTSPSPSSPTPPEPPPTSP